MPDCKKSDKREVQMKDKKRKRRNIRWMLVLYDLLGFALAAILLLGLYGGNDRLSYIGILQQGTLSLVCIFAGRLIGNVYGQIWRYGGIQCYIRLLCTDAIAFLVYMSLEMILPLERITFARMLCLSCLNLLGALSLRMAYRYAYKCGNQKTAVGRFLSWILYTVSGVKAASDKEVQKIKIAIIGAGRVGVSFAEELINNEEAAYIPRCFIDTNEDKVGREIQGIPVWSEGEATFRKLGEYEVQEIVFAIPSMDVDKKKALYDYYKKAGYKLKVYDYPTVYAAGGKRHLREFDAEDSRSSYSIGKCAAETMCASYYDEYGVDSVIIRPGHIYGPTAVESDNRVSSAWAYDVARGNDIVMKSDGAQIRSYCYCLDSASAILKVLLKGEPVHAYNISNPDSIINIREMAEILVKNAGTELKMELPTEVEKKGFNPMSNSSLDGTELLALGWKGKFDAERGFAHTVEIIKEIDQG